MTNYIGRLSDIKRSLPEFSNTEVLQKKARLLVYLLIALWLAFSLHSLIQLLFRDALPPTVAVMDEEAVPFQADRKVDIDKLSSLAIFGDIDTAPVFNIPVVHVADELLNAEKTKLNIKLTGIIHNRVPAHGSAIISYQNKSDQYQIEDKLPVGSNVYLEAVFVDRVIIKNSGVSESVWLYDGEYADLATGTQITTSPPNDTLDLRNNESTTTAALDLKNLLITEPLSVASLVNVTPHLEAGRIAGYRVTPRGNRDAFMALGFEPDDIITSVNGLQLDDIGNVNQLYRQIQETTQVSLTVIRDEQVLQMMIATNTDAGY